MPLNFLCGKDIKGKRYIIWQFYGPLSTLYQEKGKTLSIFPLKPYPNDKSLAKYRLIQGENLDFEKLDLITCANLVQLAHHSILRFSSLSRI